MLTHLRAVLRSAFWCGPGWPIAEVDARGRVTSMRTSYKKLFATADLGNPIGVVYKSFILNPKSRKILLVSKQLAKFAHEKLSTSRWRWYQS